MAEICFRVRGNANGTGREGDVLLVAPTGILLTPADIVAWFVDETVPAGWTTIPEWRRRQVRRRLLETRWLTTHTAQQIIDEGWRVDLDGAAKMIAGAESDKASYLSVGIDTNWGREDLKAFGCVRVDGLTADHLLAFCEPDMTESHLPVRVGKRRWRIRWRDYLSAAQIAALEDREVRVEAFRSVSLPLGAFYDDPRGE